MALLDCAINIKCYTVDGGRCICPLFSSPPRGIWQLKSPHPREFAIQDKKNAVARGSAGGGGRAGRRWNWLLTKLQGRQQRQPQKVTNFCTFLYRPSTTTTWNDHILNFFEDGNGKAINSIISVRTRAWPPLFSSNINSPLLSNWANWNNRKMVWKDEESILLNFTVL